METCKALRAAAWPPRPRRRTRRGPATKRGLYARSSAGQVAIWIKHTASVHTTEGLQHGEEGDWERSRGQEGAACLSDLPGLWQPWAQRWPDRRAPAPGLRIQALPLHTRRRAKSYALATPHGMSWPRSDCCGARSCCSGRTAGTHSSRTRAPPCAPAESYSAMASSRT